MAKLINGKIYDCKNCIHDEVCPVWDDYNDEPCKDGYRGLCNNYDNFKDKSQYIKLPCKVGDDFFIINQRFEKGEYTDFFIDKRKVFCFKYDGKSLTIYDFDGIGFEIDDIYFDKSKAEEKLKELNEND